MLWPVGADYQSAVQWRMLNDMRRSQSVLPGARFAIITAVTFPACARRVPLCSRALIRRKLTRCEGLRDMGMAKRSRLRFAVAAVCVLAALLSGLLAGPGRPQAEVPGERPALLRQRPVPGSRDPVRERHSGRFAFRRRPLQAGAGGDEAAAVANRRTRSCRPPSKSSRITMPRTLTWPTC